MKDSQGKTGEQIMGKLTREMIQSIYTDDDRVEDYNEVRRRLHDSSIDNKEFAMLLSLLWEYAMPKPVEKKDITSGGDSMNILINTNLDTDGD